jgi:phosphoribosylformylglycinamidine (FGAM) synthase-like enzyme
MTDAVVMTSDCNARYCYLDPQKGARLAVAEAARSLACAASNLEGAIEIATDCCGFFEPVDLGMARVAKTCSLKGRSPSPSAS